MLEKPLLVHRSSPKVLLKIFTRDYPGNLYIPRNSRRKYTQPVNETPIWIIWYDCINVSTNTYSINGQLVTWNLVLDLSLRKKTQQKMAAQRNPSLHPSPSLPHLGQRMYCNTKYSTTNSPHLSETAQSSVASWFSFSIFLQQVLVSEKKLARVLLQQKVLGKFRGWHSISCRLDVQYSKSRL